MQVNTLEATPNAIRHLCGVESRSYPIHKKRNIKKKYCCFSFIMVTKTNYVIIYWNVMSHELMSPQANGQINKWTENEERLREEAIWPFPFNLCIFIWIRKAFHIYSFNRFSSKVRYLFVLSLSMASVSPRAHMDTREHLHSLTAWECFGTDKNNSFCLLVFFFAHLRI